MRVDFDELAPEERRLLLVASPSKYKELVSQLDPKKLLKLAAMGLPAAFGLPALVFGNAVRASAYLASTWSAMDRAAQAAQPPADPRSLVERLTTRGEIPSPHLSPAEAGARFQFDPGGPEDGAAYLQSPMARDRYFLAGVANERLAQEKMAVFLELAAALGAKKVEIAGAEVASARGGGDASAPLPRVAAQLGIRAAFDARGAALRQASMEFDRPARAPFVPERVTPWLEAEPLLRALADTRLSSRPRRASITLRFGETLDVTSNLAAEIARRGIKIGGGYRSVTASVWTFDVEYWPDVE